MKEWMTLRQHRASLTTGPFGTVLAASEYVDGGVPLINPTHIRDGAFYPDSSISVSPETAQRLCRHGLVEGDIVVGRHGDVGRSALVSHDQAGWLCGGGSIAIRSGATLNPRFLQWALTSTHAREQLLAASQGATMDTINEPILMSLRLWSPPVHIQRAIADYLDAETARIDALIAKKERMRELLNRRVESLVAFHLDAVRTSSEDVPLKAIARLEVSNVDKKSYDGQEGVRLCNYTDVTSNRTIAGGLEFMTATADAAQVARLTLRRDDVIITKDSETPEDIAEPAWVSADLPGVVLGYHLALLRPFRVDGHYLFWCLRSRRCRDAFTVAASGVTRFGLRQDDIRKVSIPLPPPDEQHRLAHEIERVVSSQDRMVRRLADQISLLRERRQALITAAVTGELDIPGVAA